MTNTKHGEMTDHDITERLRCPIYLEGPWLSRSNARDMQEAADEIDKLRNDRDSYRQEGWKAGMEEAAELCRYMLNYTPTDDDLQQMYQNGFENACELCDEAIRSRIKDTETSGKE